MLVLIRCHKVSGWLAQPVGANEHSLEKSQKSKSSEWVVSELKLSESLTSAEEPWHHPSTFPCCRLHTFPKYATVQPPFTLVSHQTRLDPTALHHSILSRWVELSEPVSSPETSRTKSSQTALLERINFLLTPSFTHHRKPNPKIT